jgi:hypothetical protein
MKEESRLFRKNTLNSPQINFNLLRSKKISNNFDEAYLREKKLTNIDLSRKSKYLKRSGTKEV